MTSIDILGAQASVRTYDVLTTGMVGATVEFRFDKSWDNLVRTAVFRQGAVTKDVVNIGTTAKIPPEVLMIPGLSVKIGVLGTNSDGTVVIPTVWAETRPVKDGTDPSGDESADPTLPVWEQILATIGDMHSLSTEAKGNLVASINELVQLCEDGTVDAEYIQQEVEKYLKENPVTETDPTVPAWAKQPEKPKYTAQEVGALPADTVIPTIPDNVSAFRNDAGYLTEHQDLTGYATEQYVQGYAQPKGNYLTEVPAGYAKTEEIPTKPSDIGAQPSGNYALKSEIPSVPVKSVNGKTGAVSITASDVGARPSTWMPSASDAGALPASTTIPTKTSQLTNDSGFIKGYTETDPTVPSWAKASSKPSYSKSEVGLGNVDNVKQYSASNPPPYPVTSVNGKTGAVQIEIPKFDPTVYGLPVLYLTGDTTGMSKDVKKTLDYSCTDAAGNAHTGTCTVKWQGNTSVNYEKKNYTIKFDSAFEACSGWGEQEKYCFKANFTDHSHCRNVVSAKLWGKIRKNRSGLDSKLKALPNAGAIDGFPAIIMLNGEFHGLYTWNIPKDQWMFGMGGGTQEAILMAHGPCDPVRFKAPALVDEEDYEMEFVTDEDNSAWVATSLNRLINACIASWGGDLDTAIAPYLDWESAIDYYIFAVVIDGRDIMEKNFILATYNGTKWFFSAYDLDSNYGMRWNAVQTYRPDDTAGDSATFENFANKHRLFELIKRFKTNDLKARYASLRKTVLHELAIAEMFENFAWAIPSPVLVEDVKLYPSIRGSAVNNVDQILRWIHHRLTIVDAWIEALPAQEEPVNPLGYTNQVPTSIDTDGSVFNGVGYQNGGRISTSAGNMSTDNSLSTISGYIPAKNGDVIRVYGVDWVNTSGTKNVIAAYDSNFGYIGSVYGNFKATATGIFSATEVLNDHDVSITLKTKNEMANTIAYVRVSSLGLGKDAIDGANMIVTVNEEITE